MEDLIKREDATETFAELYDIFDDYPNIIKELHRVYDKILAIPSAENKGEWIPCSERLPKDLEIVNVTWVNRRPQSYYADIKDKPFTATAIHHRDRWWWYSPICEDLLAKYGKSECDKMNADIEVTAWMPLPEPWKGEGDETI